MRKHATQSSETFIDDFSWWIWIFKPLSLQHNFKTRAVILIDCFFSKNIFEFVFHGSIHWRLACYSISYKTLKKQISTSQILQKFTQAASLYPDSGKLKIVSVNKYNDTELWIGDYHLINQMKEHISLKPYICLPELLQLRLNQTKNLSFFIISNYLIND